MTYCWWRRPKTCRPRDATEGRLRHCGGLVARRRCGLMRNSRVGEGNGTLAGAVEGGEQEGKGRDDRQVTETVLREEETATGNEQSPEHVGERQQQQRAAAESIDRWGDC